MCKGPWTVRQFAERLGVSQAKVRKLIAAKRIIGVSKHPLTKKWMIYPPAKVLLSTKGPWT